jgi:hypothetical protein
MRWKQLYERVYILGLVQGIEDHGAGVRISETPSCCCHQGLEL